MLGELVKWCSMQNNKLCKDKTCKAVIIVENYFKTHWQYGCLHAISIQIHSLNPSTQTKPDDTTLS